MSAVDCAIPIEIPFGTKNLNLKDYITKSPGKKRNASKEGFEIEQKFGAELLDYVNKTQKHGFRNYVIDPDSLCTNFKLYIAGEAITENDINFSFYRESWLVRSFNKFFYLRDSENVAIQSKYYSSDVPFEKILKDMVHCLMTHRIGYNLQANSIIVCKEKSIDSSLEHKLKNEFRIPVMTEDELGSDYGVIKSKGKNLISMSKFINNSGKEGYWDKIRTNYVGDLTVLDESNVFRDKLRLVNIIWVDSLKDEFSTVEESLNYQLNYLNPEYYIYASGSSINSKEDKISPKGREFLELMNAKSASYNSIKEVLNDCKFFREFKKINYTPFGIGKEVIGQCESNVYRHLKDLEGSEHFNFKTLSRATERFLSSIPHVR